MAKEGYSQFVQISEQIMAEIQDAINKIEQSQTKQKIVSLCKQFMTFYQFCILKDEEEIQNFKNQYDKMVLPTEAEADDLLIEKFHINKTIKKITNSKIQRIRQLESLLTAFKHLFLKYLNIDLIQVVVVQVYEEKTGTYKPEIFQMGNFSHLASLIERSASQMQGRLASNQKLLNKLNGSDEYDNENSDINKKYIQVYKQTRRRLNVYYQKVRHGATSGTALLLYRPKNKWIKFRVNNLGDVKQGYVAMIVDKPNLEESEEKNVQIFAQNYISKVDNIAGTLFQDVQVMKDNKIQTLISVKSGSAETGSHSGIIDLIYQIAKDGNLDGILSAFNEDAEKAKSGSGQRNRVLTQKESIDKIANDMGEVVDISADTALRKVINAVRK